MLFGMQAVDDELQRGIEEFGRENRRHDQRDQRPPHGFRFSCHKKNNRATRKHALRSEACLAFKTSMNTLDGVANSMMKRAVFHLCIIGEHLSDAKGFVTVWPQ